MFIVEVGKNKKCDLYICGLPRALGSRRSRIDPYVDIEAFLVLFSAIGYSLINRTE